MHDMNAEWSENDWDMLVLNIRKGHCTPFLGAGVAVPALPLGGAVAEAWAKEYDYPFPDKTNLARVAQYVAVDRGDYAFPKMKIGAEIGEAKPPLSSADEPHHVLASLNLPLYLTTNYDDFMHRALTRTKPKAVREHCRWYESLVLRKRHPVARVNPTPEIPVVYHLHGIADKWNSIVITEEDYLNFLIITSEFPSIPTGIIEAFAEKSLLFLGYSLQDINFRVLFRKFAPILTKGRRHFAVQIEPGPGDTEKQKKDFEKQRLYLEKELKGQQVTVFWGTCAAFCKELSTRCQTN